MIVLLVCVGLSLLAFAARPLGRWRYRRSVEHAVRRANFQRLLEQARLERIERNSATGGDKLPW